MCSCCSSAARAVRVEQENNKDPPESLISRSLHGPSPRMKIRLDQMQVLCNNTVKRLHCNQDSPTEQNNRCTNISSRAAFSPTESPPSTSS